MIVERVICDRCRKEFKGGHNLKRRIDYGIDIIDVNEGNKYVPDLCQECIDDLQKWFYINPVFKKTTIKYYLGTQKYEYSLEVNTDDNT